MYLLDADSIITADRDPYPLNATRVFWDWLAQMGRYGNVKIPREQYEEITAGSGEIVDWLKGDEIKVALLLDEEASPDQVQIVAAQYAIDLTEDEIEQIGRDPFLISYALADPGNRIVVTFERSAPSKQRANKKIPDICASLGVHTRTLYQMAQALNFRWDWRPEDSDYTVSDES